MPLIKLQTSQKVEPAAQKEMLLVFSKYIAKTIGKPETYVMTLFESPVPMTMGGTPDPAMFIEVKSIGNLSADKTSELAKGLCDLVQTNFKISADRVYINFADIDRSCWGWNGSTF